MSGNEHKIVEKQELKHSDLLPVLDPEQAKEAYTAYLKLCQAILVPYDKRIVDENGVIRQESDYVRIAQKKKVDGKWITEYVDAPKKSAFRKLAKFYGVSTEILEKSKEIHENDSYTWHYSVKAIAPSGTFTTGEGDCTSSEKGGKSEHDTRATAHTRAKSRAISDLIGFGQVSAEEYDKSVNVDHVPNAEEIRRQVESDFTEKPKEPLDLTIDGIKAYFEQLGYDSEKFTIRHDKPTRMFVVDDCPFFKDGKWDEYLNDVREMGGEYNQEYKKTVFRY